MRLSAIGFLMILTTMFLSGCGQQKMASLDDRAAQFYGHATPTTQTAAVEMASIAPASAPMPTTTMVTSTEKMSFPATAPVTPAHVSTADNGSWQWPVEGKVIEAFGRQREGIASEGITIAAVEGAPIHAARAGEVAYVGKNVRDYGDMVIVRHSNNVLTSYAHTGEILVKKGDKVQGGQVIALVGKSGSAKMPQLHFALRDVDRAVDPLSKLPQRLASN